MTDAHRTEETASPSEIHFRSLSGDTQHALREWLLRIDRDDLADKTWWQFDEFCGIWFRLRAEADDPDLFPRGKWTTLQRMEQLIAESIAGRGEAR